MLVSVVWLHVASFSFTESSSKYEMTARGNPWYKELGAKFKDQVCIQHTSKTIICSETNYY